MKTTRRSLCLASAALAFGLTVGDLAAAQEKIKIGLLLTYSGPSGAGGVMADNTIKLFQEKNGTTVAGKTIEFVKRDTTGPNPEVVKRLAQELIVREKVQILIGPDFTANVMAVAPLVTESKTPTFLSGAATTGIVGERSPYFVRTFFAIRQMSATMAQWAIKNGVRKPFVVVGDFAPGHETEEIFTKAFTAAGGALAGSARISLRSPEFSSYMQRIKDARPDAVFVFLPIGDMAIQFMKAYADSGLKASGLRLLGTGDLTDESLIDALGDSAAGVVTTGWYSVAHPSAMNRQFVADFEGRFGKTPRLGAPQVAVWDTLRLIYDGLAAQGSAPFNAEKLIAFAKGRSFESPRGPITLDRQTGDIVQDVYVRRVEKREGQWQNVEFETFKAVAPK